MKKSIITALFALLSLSSFANDPMLIDSTDDKTLIKTFSDISMKLSPDERQDFSNASAIIMFYGTAMEYNEETMRQLFHKKDAKSLIALAQSYCPAKKDENYKLKSETKADFSRSFIVMLMNLPIEKQRKFSHIIAQIMMVAQLNKLDEESLLKELNGLTGDEIIANFDAVKASAEATKK